MRKTPVTPHSSLSVISKTQATGYQKLVGITIKKKSRAQVWINYAFFP